MSTKLLARRFVERLGEVTESLYTEGLYNVGCAQVWRRRIEKSACEALPRSGPGNALA
jgi:hypothetical protein